MFVKRRYDTVFDIVSEISSLLKPPEDLTVSQSAAKYRYHYNPGSYTGPHKNEMTPYMIEPQDTLLSPEHNAEIFVGPAQSSKTDSLLLNWLIYGVMCDPMDVIFYNPTSGAARDFSMRRVDRLHRHSKPVGNMLSKSRDADNKFDKHYINGMMLSLSHPSPTEVAGKPVARCAITDYDRIDDDIGGEGAMFDLVTKRNTTFGSFAMTVAESSPSRELTDTRWIAKTAHEAPPTTGILSLYNRGDKRRWYWPCPHCDSYFEGTFDMLKWDEMGDKAKSAATVRMICPCCNGEIKYEDRYEMNLWGQWLRDGQYFNKDGLLVGEGVTSSIASFWLNGVAASFVTWKKLVETYLTANDEYQKTGSEESLKKFFNTDLAQVYIPQAQDSDLIPEQLKGRAEHFCEEDERVVPENVRCLVANIDVQKNMFVVQVHGVLPGKPFDTVIVDRFDIRKSKRIDEDGDTMWVKPGVYLEDWDLIREQVMERSYPLQGDSSRRMPIKITTCDSGGKAGVTAMVYDFYRNLRSLGVHQRFVPLKGQPNINNPRTQVNYPDAQNKDKKSPARGDVPVLMLNSNMLKDMLSNRLECITPGMGLCRFPDWLPDWWYKEICAETRVAGKGWENPRKHRNEAWDLLYYFLGVCISPKHLAIDRVDWDNPPGWLAPWDKNTMIYSDGETSIVEDDDDETYDFSKFGEALA